MANGLDAMVGVLPVIMVSGVAMKMTEGMFNQRGTNRGQRPLRKPRRRAFPRRSTGVGFGNFSNIGI